MGHKEKAMCKHVRALDSGCRYSKSNQHGTKLIEKHCVFVLDDPMKCLHKTGSLSYCSIVDYECTPYAKASKTVFTRADSVFSNYKYAATLSWSYNFGLIFNLAQVDIEAASLLKDTYYAASLCMQLVFNFLMESVRIAYKETPSKCYEMAGKGNAGSGQDAYGSCGGDAVACGADLVLNNGPPKGVGNQTG